MAQLVKNMTAMWETWVRSLGWEDPLEKGKATHSSILAWRILSGLENSIVAKSWTRLSVFHILYLKLLWNIDYIFCAVLEKIKKKMIKNEEEAVGQRGMQRPCSQKELGEIKRLIESWRG